MVCALLYARTFTVLKLRNIRHTGQFVCVCGSLGDVVVAVQPSISGIHLCERVGTAIKQLKRVPGRNKHGTDCATFTHQNLNGVFRGLLL